MGFIGRLLSFSRKESCLSTLLEGYCSVKVIHDLISGSRFRKASNCESLMKCMMITSEAEASIRSRQIRAWSLSPNANPFLLRGRLNPSHWHYRPLAWGFITCGWHETKGNTEVIDREDRRMQDTEEKETWTRRKSVRAHGTFWYKQRIIMLCFCPPLTLEENIWLLAKQLNAPLCSLASL